MKKKSMPKGLRLTIQGLPLAAAAGASLLSVSRLGQQFVILVVLIWIQVFFIVECFLAGK